METIKDYEAMVYILEHKKRDRWTFFVRVSYSSIGKIIENKIIGEIVHVKEKIIKKQINKEIEKPENKKNVKSNGKNENNKVKNFEEKIKSIEFDEDNDEDD